MSSARSYRLGIDLGTTYTAAVVCRRASGDAWSEPEIVALGSQSASVASVLYLAEDGTVLVGEAAERRGLTEPDRVVRQFKRRIGDDVPLVVGSAVHTAHDLAARMGRWVVDRVAEREGGPPDAIAVTHPAAWGAHKKNLLAGALRQVGLDGITFLPEPQAAAVTYSSRERVDAGGAVAVYDLGGGTFDAAVVRRTASGFELPGRAEGIEQLGGVDFDDRVFDHVRDGIGSGLDELDFEDPEVVSAVLRLRRECVEAKEALSFDTEATIPVMLPGIRTNVRLTRVEFEALIRGSVDHTVDALTRAVGSAGLTAADLQAVLLVGGSSRIPLVAQRISEELGRPVAVDSDPKTSIAMGAALTIAPRPAHSAAPGPAVHAAVAPPAPAAPAAPYGYATPGAVPAAPVAPVAQPAASYAAAPARVAPTPTRGGPGSSSGVLDLRALAQQPPAPPRPGSWDGAPSAPPRPAVGGRDDTPPPPAPASTYPPRPEVQGRAAEDDDEDPPRNVRKIVLIVVICALVLFAVAFGIGVWMNASKAPSPGSSGSAPTRSALPSGSTLF